MAQPKSLPELTVADLEALRYLVLTNAADLISDAELLLRAHRYPRLVSRDR